MTAIEQPGLSYSATLRGRRTKGGTLSAATFKILFVRPELLHHALEDEFAHLAWGVDFELARNSTVAVPLYTSCPTLVASVV